jgi:tetratricopeptide (TPR) repeat protein
MGHRRSTSAWLLAAAVAIAPGVVEAGESDNHIAYYQRLLQRHPNDARTHLRLGDALVRKARETGDNAYFDRAEAALRRSLELTPASAGAWRHLAYVFYSRHQFAEAETYARKAVALDAADGHAWGVLGDTLLETGRYDEAGEVYARMLALEPDLHAWARRAGLRSLRGELPGANADLERAVAEGRAAGRPAESIAWALWQLGTEHFMIGDLAAAEGRFAESLAAYPDYHRALAGMGQVRAAQARYEEAVTLYRRALAGAAHPEYASPLGDVLTRLGRTDEARAPYGLVEALGRLDDARLAQERRELAYFYADHDRELPRALDLARQDLAERRDVYGHDLLAWVLLKNGRAAEAREAITTALGVGTRDAWLFFHAGMIHQALGEPERAREYLTLALATNPHFHVLHADTARRALAALPPPAAPGPAAE